MFVPAYRGAASERRGGRYRGHRRKAQFPSGDKEAVIYWVEVDASQVKKFAEFDLAPVGILDLWRLLSMSA